jgi:hypothetical protein
LSRLHRFCLGWCFVHFFLIATACLNGLAWLIENGYTVLPLSTQIYGKRAGELTDAALGRTLPESNPLPQSLSTYMQVAGIEGSYSFFAPSVSCSYKVVFEIHYPTGEIEYDLPHISEKINAIRLSTLLDYVGRTRYEPLCEVLLKMLTRPVWQEHPKATMIRTIFGYIEEPSVVEGRKGKKESYRVMYAYDFSLSSGQAKNP